ncbi:hypothetical protein BLNAU_16334 [Blattamonas nauphoetae]|uniref:Uncharacterized protein n=1 Tax=Blattamonas nauphoetae TaxID=2049346 RepID=A0ABQ9X8C4_9EUKA|nr:hypothetical protein BLNAU_16334 [Blattamonas nauphoetae]
MGAADSKLAISTDSPCLDDKAVIFRSLVAAVKFQPALDVSLQAKAVKLLRSVDPQNRESADAFLNSIGRTTDESSTIFVQSIVILLSSPNRAVATTTMKILERMLVTCSRHSRLTLVNANLIPQLIASLNPLSLSFTEAVDLHINLVIIISNSIWLASPFGLRQLGIEDDNEQQAVHETVLKQVLAPSKQVSFAGTVGILSRQSRSIVATLTFSFAATLALLNSLHRKALIDDDNSEGSEDVVAELMAVLDPCSPSPPSPSHSPLPLPHHPHPPTPLCLSLTTHTLPLPSAAYLTIHTLPLPSASPSPPTPSHSPLPLPHHPHPPTPLCLSLTTHILPPISQSVSAAADEARCRISSLSPTTPHLIPRCPLTLSHTRLQPHSREGRDCSWLT